MKPSWLMLGPLTALAIGLWAVVAPSEGGESAEHPQLAIAAGRTQVQGHDVIVEILVAAPRGSDARAVAQASLRRAYPGAAPLVEVPESTSYTTTGLIWNTLPVTVNYNDGGSPLATAKTEMLAAMQTWTDVPTSSFAFSNGPDTTRCPSLVNECPGAQTFDGKNDVGWINITDPNVLGVTWYSTGGTDEFDMAIDNANFTWVAGCSGNYSLQTVYLHEFGHALGLGHSSSIDAVMYPSYRGPHCPLDADDIAGVTALYPMAGGSTPTATATRTATSVPTLTATPPPGTTPTATATVCPPGKARRGKC